MLNNKRQSEVTLLHVVYGGDCLARQDDGRALFVPFGLPGEKVRVEITEEKKTFDRGRILEVITPSPERISPPCPHFMDCGGCHFQHIPYPTQLALKQAMVREQFQRIADMPEPPVQPVIPSPTQWFYRNSVQYHLDAAGKTGFQANASHRVVPIKECLLTEKTLEEVRPQFEFDPESGIEKMELRLGDDNQVLVLLESASIEIPEMEVEMPVSLVHSSPAGQVVISGEDFLIFRVLERDFVVSAASFFQVNTRQVEDMVNYLLKTLPLTLETTLMDVYCGVGLFSAFMAPRVKQCIGIECASSSCRDFIVNLEEFDNVSLYEGLAEQVLPALDVKAQVMLVDPPRAGLDVKALDAIIEKHPDCLVYVSCDPSTLARDAKRLVKGGYRLESIQPFDLFPQTYHIENICIFH